ncbi:type II toxin-antitoxin system RelE/ParE family toxin [Bacteroides sp.]
MPIKIKWTKRAGKHLESIYAYLATNSEQAAVKIYNELIDSADILKTFPMSGKKEPELEKSPLEYRSLVACEHYKLIYYIDNDVAKIMAVWDCRQKPNRLKKIFLR